MDQYHYTESKSDKLGEGTYGTVFKAVDRETGRKVAVKKAKLEVSVDEGIPCTVLREVALLKVAGKKGNNVVRLENACYEADKGGKLALFLVFEQLDCDLKRYMDKMVKQGLLTDDLIKYLMRQILVGVDALHKLGIVHRDLKPQNILVGANGSGLPEVKIADLGLARNPTFPMGEYTHEIMTLWYRAPEVLLGGDYSLQVDMWSAGCILAELYRRRPLLAGDCEFQQLLLIFQNFGTPNEEMWPGVSNLPYWHEYPQWRTKMSQEILHMVNNDRDAADLLLRMLEYDPAKRITADDALIHPYFTRSTSTLLGARDQPLGDLPPQQNV